MIDYVQVLWLSLLQGLTEFLPISSSAHLILLPLVAHFPDQGLAFDIAVHLGTLTAVVVYFRRTIKWLFWGFIKSFYSQKCSFYTKLAWMLIIASVPIGLGGLLGHHFIEQYARAPLVIASTTLIFALLLWFADKVAIQQGNLRQLSYKKALIIGSLQVLALIPGTSRSGITLTGGLLLGLNKKSAATFSFLLSIPAILMAGTYQGMKLLQTPWHLPWGHFLLGFGLSAISAFCCIHLFLKLISKVGLLPFVIYRIILASILFYVFL